MNNISIEEAEKRITEIANSLDEQDRDSFALKCILFTVTGCIKSLNSFSHQIHELHMLCWKFSCEKVVEMRNKIEESKRLLLQ